MTGDSLWVRAAAWVRSEPWHVTITPTPTVPKQRTLLIARENRTLEVTE